MLLVCLSVEYVCLFVVCRLMVVCGLLFVVGVVLCVAWCSLLGVACCVVFVCVV